jgi:hypothetical protein
MFVVLVVESVIMVVGIFADVLLVELKLVMDCTSYLVIAFCYYWGSVPVGFN